MIKFDKKHKKADLSKTNKSVKEMLTEKFNKTLDFIDDNIPALLIGYMLLVMVVVCGVGINSISKHKQELENTDHVGTAIEYIGDNIVLLYDVNYYKYCSYRGIDVLKIRTLDGNFYTLDYDSPVIEGDDSYELALETAKEHVGEDGNIITYEENDEKTLALK